MLTSENKKCNQIHIFCIDDLVPQDHMLRKIEKAIEWSFIYDLVKDRYSEEKEAGDKRTVPLSPGIVLEFSSSPPIPYKDKKKQSPEGVFQ